MGTPQTKDSKTNQYTREVIYVGTLVFHKVIYQKKINPQNQPGEQQNIQQHNSGLREIVIQNLPSSYRN